MPLRELMFPAAILTFLDSTNKYQSTGVQSTLAATLPDGYPRVLLPSSMNTALRRLPSRVQLDRHKAGASLISPHISFSLRTAWASASPVPLFHFPVRSLTTSQYQPFEYHWIEDVERLELYMQGGYHPVRINDKLHDRYLIVDKLGSGGYSTIWLAQDQRLNRYVALKVIIAQASSLHLTRESSILRKLSEVSLPSPKAYSMSMVSEGRDAITSILDEFTVQGPNGIHSCYAMSPAQGSLMEASFNRLFPIQVCRILAAKLVLAVSYVHSRGVVHGGSFNPRFLAYHLLLTIIPL